MSCWAENYVGRPAATTLADNCLGTVRRIKRQVFRQPFPGQLSFVRHVLALGLPLENRRVLDELAFDGCRLRRVKRLRDGTVIVCGTPSNPMKHVGVYCAQADRMIHAVTDIPEPVVQAVPVWRLKHEWQMVDYLEVVPA